MYIFGIRWRRVVSFTTRPSFPCAKRPQHRLNRNQSGWALELVWILCRRDKSVAPVVHRTVPQLSSP